MTRLLRKAQSAWSQWHFNRRMYRERPELRHIDEAISRARRQHKSVAHFIAAKQAVINDALRSSRRVEG